MVREGGTERGREKERERDCVCERARGTEIETDMGTETTAIGVIMTVGSRAQAFPPAPRAPQPHGDRDSVESDL